MACSVNMFFGERLLANGTFEIFMSEQDQVYIENYDCTMISKALGLNFTDFTLTEEELLATASMSCWTSYIGTPTANQTELFGYKVFESLFGADGLAKLRDLVADNFEDLALNQNTGAMNSHMNSIAKEDAAVNIPKLEQAHAWISSIHSDFYGKQYLIQIGDDTAGVCIKDRFGNIPAGNIKIESEGGLYYSSDSPASGGAWPNAGQVQVLGLNVGSETLLFQESDNRIGAFVKLSDYKNVSKYNHTWEVDLSSLSDDNFYKQGEDLFIKAGLSDALYQYDNKQYILLEMSAVPRLQIKGDGELCPANLMSQGAIAVMALFESHYSDVDTALQDIFCDDPNNTKNGTVPNRSAFNVLNSNKPSIVPDNFICPMKSNLFVYGPWFHQTNPVGGTIVDPNKELCPWRFSDGNDDGYTRMDVYGNLIANDGPRGLQKQESGSITVAALPSYNLGHIVAQNAATLTDISISIGESGYTTTYNFQTYTPKFGSPGRALKDLWSKSYQSMSYLNKYFKDQKLELNKLINNNDIRLQDAQARRFDVDGAVSSGVSEDAGKGATTSSSSPGVILFSGFFYRDKEDNAQGGADSHDGSSVEMTPCSKCRDSTTDQNIPEKSVDSDGNILQNRPFSMLEKAYSWEHIKENTFKRLALSSLDLIFGGISTKTQEDQEAELPRLSLYTNYDADYSEWSDKEDDEDPGRPPKSRPRLEIPPFEFMNELEYDLPIHQQYLNSVTSGTMLSSWDDRSNSSTKGFIAYLISAGETYEDFKLTILDENETDRQEFDNFRYNALRGPLTLQSWGYDTSGKPIPNAIDSANNTERGKFRRKGLKDKFLKDWLENPKSWPVGPIDLRWDRERGVWVSPPANKIVVARLTQNLNKFGVAEAELIDPEAGSASFYEYYDIWDKDGRNIKVALTKTKIKVYDFLGIDLCKCDHVYAYYDDNRYIVLESSRAYKDPNELCCTTATPVPSPHTTIPTSCWCNLECLQTLKGYQEGKHQALVHKSETGGPDCLVWEDIVECYTPPPEHFIE
jgi:hypothetical protein